ncbi:MAG: sterol desaturase family protein [Myxococcaceae bacterium]|nr:sterol desaturase family protein [Myxococcaceae bacterium]
MVGIPLGLAWANAFEWVFHKYILHERGQDKRSFWSFHWHEHHRESRKHAFEDPCYRRSVFSWSPQGKEAAALAAGAVAVAPLFPVAPFFVGTLWWSALHYYRVHKRSHLDPEWAKANLPWHYDHHMGKDQNANWCVTHPWFDYVMGTRKRYDYDEKLKATEQLAPEAGGVLGRARRYLGNVVTQVAQPI